MKLDHAKTIMVNFTDVWLKGLKILTSNRIDVGIVEKYVRQFFLNETQSVK